MPYLSEKTETIELTNPEYWVKVRTSLNWGEMKQISSVTEEGQTTYQVDAMLLMCIKDWNLDDSDGVKLEITAVNIDQIERPDIELIIKTLGGKLEEKDSKKDS